MAKQIQITMEPYGVVSLGDMDRIAYEAVKFIQGALPSKLLGYGVIEVPGLEVATADALLRSRSAADTIRETAAPIRMLSDHLL